MNFKKILAGMSAMAIASTMTMAAFADVQSASILGGSSVEQPTEAEPRTVFEGSTTFDAAWALAEGDYIKISPTALGTLAAGDKVTITAAPLDATAESKITIQTGAWGDITGAGYPVVTADKTEYDFVLDDTMIEEINENIGDDGATALVVKGGNVVITKVTVTTAAGTPETPDVPSGIEVDEENALMVISGNDGEEKTALGWVSNPIDTTSLTAAEKASVRKITVDYVTNTTWVNGKIQVNVADSTAKKGYKNQGNSSGSCFAWDLGEDGNPQLWGNSAEGIAFDVETGKGTAEWTLPNLAAEGEADRYEGIFFAEDDEFDAEEGDATGLSIQLGDMNNVKNADGTYTGAKFAINAVTLYDANGEVIKKFAKEVAPAKPPIEVDTTNAIAVVKGNDGEEKTDKWDQNNFIDLTKYDASKIDKVVVDYQTDTTWSNGKLGANIIDASSKKGYKFTAAPGACLAWDLDEEGNPQLWGQSNEGVTFDVETGNGSIEWTGLTGKLYQDPDVEFDPEDEGDSTGLTLQVGTMNNIQNADGTYKGATFAIKSVKFYDKNGKEVTPKTTPVKPAVTKPAAVSKITGAAVSSSSVKLSWTASKGAKGYSVYKYDTAKKAYVLLASTTKTSITVTKNLKAGTSYRFAVAPYALDGTKKVYGDKKGVSVKTKVATPSAIKRIVATTTNKSVKLAWTKAANAKGYAVYKYDTAKKKYILAAYTTKTTLTLTKGVKEGTKYSYAVKPYNLSGKTRIYGAAKKISAVTKVAKPAAVKVVKVTAGKGAATVAWTKSSTAGVTYKVYAKTTPKGKSTLVASTKSTKVIVKKLKKNKVYYFSVVATKKVGSKVYSSAAVTKSAKIK